MKVVCIEPFIGNSVLKTTITYGKTYDVINDMPIKFLGIKNSKFNATGFYLKIINDLGVDHMYDKSRFITLEEWREKQLKEIGL